MFCSNSYQTWGHTIPCLWINQCVQCGMQTSFRGVAGLMQDAGEKECRLKTREKETTFFFSKFTLLSVYLNKTTEMEPLGKTNGNLLPPPSMWFPSNYCHLLLVVPMSLPGFSSCQSQPRSCKDVLQPWAWGGEFIKPIYSIEALMNKVFSA